MRMQRKVVAVTGAAGEIGQALAMGFAAQGGRVACVDIDEPGALATAEKVREAGGDAVSIRCDVTIFRDVVNSLDAIVDCYGSVDVLLANAGGSRGETVEFLALSTTAWSTMIERNFTSAFYCGLIYARHMAEKGGGSIVFTSSELGEVARPGLAHYCAAKGGVKQLMRGMAVDLAQHGVRVNAVAPGPTLTRGTRQFFAQAEVHGMLESIPLGRIAQPEEIVGAAVYLASDDASYTTGATLMVDGGVTAL